MSDKVEQQEPEAVVISTELYKGVLQYLGTKPLNEVANLYNGLMQNVKAFVEPTQEVEPEDTREDK